MIVIIGSVIAKVILLIVTVKVQLNYVRSYFSFVYNERSKAFAYSRGIFMLQRDMLPFSL